MRLLKIDENGFFLEDVFLDEIPTTSVESEDGEVTIDDPQYISTPCPDGFHNPKWNGEEWIEALSVEEISELLSKTTKFTETEKLWDAITYLLTSGL